MAEKDRKRAKVERVMREFGQGSLRSGSSKGPVVKGRKQAVAIALSEAGAKPKRATGGAIPTKAQLRRRAKKNGTIGRGVELTDGALQRRYGGAV